MNAPVGGVMGPMSNSLGLGEGTMYQNLENRVNRHYYGGEKVPLELREGLPGAAIGLLGCWQWFLLHSSAYSSPYSSPDAAPPRSLP
jgi:hypothetical protein